jgi:hypothetical protein
MEMQMNVKMWVAAAALVALAVGGTLAETASAGDQLAWGYQQKQKGGGGGGGGSSSTDSSSSASIATPDSTVDVAWGYKQKQKGGGGSSSTDSSSST